MEKVEELMVKMLMFEGSKLVDCYYNSDGFTPVNVTPKRRANSPANDMKAETLPLFSCPSCLPTRIRTYVAGASQFSIYECLCSVLRQKYYYDGKEPKIASQSTSAESVRSLQ